MTDPRKALRDLFPLLDIPDMEPSYNVAPTQEVLAVRVPPGQDKPEPALLKWGLVPSWADDPAVSNRLINAPLDRVWSTLIDVERWPESTTSMISVERLDDGPFRSGSSARIKQPKLPSMIWTVTDLQPQHAFAWTTSSPGATTIAGHVLEPTSSDSVTVTLSVRRTGVVRRNSRSCALAASAMGPSVKR